MKHYWNKIAPSVLLAVLIGCGGGGQGDNGLGTEATFDNGDQGQNIPPAGAVNGDLSGRLFATRDFKPYEFNLATGSVTQLPLLSTYEFLMSQPGDGASSEFNYFTAVNRTSGVVFAETLYDCFRVPDRSCLSFFDENFQVVSRLSTDDRVLTEPSKISLSGQYAVLSDMELFFNDSAFLVIIDIESGQAIETLEIDNTLATRESPRDNPVVEWGLNDEIIFTVPSDNRPTVYVTNPETLEIARTIQLPASYTGFINSLDLHPDGNLLLLEYRVLGEFNSTVIVLDLDTLDIRFPAVHSDDADSIPLSDEFQSQFTNPMWSPEGSNIMFLNRFSLAGAAVPNEVIEMNGFSVVNPGIPLRDAMVVVPAESDRVIVNQVNQNTPPPARYIQFEDRFNPGTLVFEWQADTIFSAHVDWID